MKKIFFLLFTLSIFSQLKAQNIDDLRRFFNYDPSQDLNFHVFSTTDTTEATIFLIQYAGGNGMQVTAYLIIPKSELRRYPAVIFLHGLGQDKNAFLSNALELADKSIASLLIDAPPARMNSQKMNFQNYTDPKKEILVFRQTVLDIRRAIDLLGQHPKIDPDRLAFVGIDYGSWTGAIVAGIENRILTYVLMDCPLQPTLDLRNSTDPQIIKIRNTITPEQLSQYEVNMKKFDPINYLAYHRNSNILFQYADSSTNISRTMINNTFQTTSEPKKLELYKIPSGELIKYSEAFRNRKKWLYDHL